MALTPALLDTFRTHGAALHSAISAGGDAHLAPVRLSGAATGRLRAGIAALESWLRRVLILLALELEPALQPGRPYAKYRRRRRLAPRRHSLRIFPSGRPLDAATRDRLRRLPRGRRWQAGFGADLSGGAGSSGQPSVWAAPLLARLSALRDLVEAPEARARRLAWHLARRRPGRFRAPRYTGPRSGRLFGTETGALHDGLGHAIFEASRARPPPLGPATRLGPRLRQL